MTKTEMTKMKTIEITRLNPIYLIVNDPNMFFYKAGQMISKNARTSQMQGSFRANAVNTFVYMILAVAY